MRYLELVHEPEFNELTRPEQEKLIGVDRQTLWRWSKQVDWDRVRETMKSRYAQEAPKIFGSIVKKATKGDGKAQELYLQYFLGWSLKQNLEISRGADKELTQEQLFQALKDALPHLSPEQRAQLVGTGQETPVLDVQSESTGVVDGDKSGVEGESQTS